MRGSTWSLATRHTLFAIGALAVAASPARAQRSRTGTLAGRVRDDAGIPVANVEVSAVKHGLVARTDSVGRFLIATIPAGALDLTFRRLAFEPVVVTIDLAADDTTDVEVKLTVVAQRLTGVVINDNAPKKRVLAGFEARRHQGIGYFVTRAEIEKREPRLLSDMLRMIPGTILIAGDAGRIQLRFTRSARNCPPQFFVDGIMATGMGIDDISVSDVEGVEIFAGAAGLPSEFARMRSTSNCGTVLIWTRIPGV
jgi:carboxypeptidase family protein/TonB-dependent receptor-like protein